MGEYGPFPAAVLPAGIQVGHWTDRAGLTGCTVVLAPGGAAAGVDVRGGAPGTLGTDALRPGNLAKQAHGILLTGGSAYGLNAADGVMRFLAEQGSGLEVGPVRVPIVAGAVVFDLLNGDQAARPDAASGYAACQAATSAPATGAVGAGTGATVAKAGGNPPLPGGLGIATAQAGRAMVTAIMVGNGVGGIWDDDRHEWIAALTDWQPGPEVLPAANTTIGVVVTDADLTKTQANRLAAVAHDGIAMAVRPAHTMYDGDTIFVLATGLVPAEVSALEAVAGRVVAQAIASGVRAGIDQSR